MVAIKTHYTAAELAALRLPCLPGSAVGIRGKAERDNWSFVEEKGLGGTRRMYAPPKVVLEEIAEQAARDVVATVPATGLALRPAPQLPLLVRDGQDIAMDARKGVLQALDILMRRFGYTKKRAARMLVEMARAGEAGEQLTAMLRLARDGRGRPSPDGLPSERSVLRFVEYAEAGMLAPKKRQADMSVPAWAAIFLEHYQRPEKPTVTHAYRTFLAALDERQRAAAPSEWQVRRFLGKIGNVTLQLGRMGDREIKTIRQFVRRDFSSLLPGDIYSADGHTLDAEVQHPLHGRPFRPEITSVVDIATRRLVGWSVALAESALAVLDALRSAVLTGGIPAILYVDNGSGYKNELMTDVGTGLLARLGTEMVNSLPYNSQARGVIERLHQTVWVNAAKQLPGYIGHDMDRQAKHEVFKVSRKALKAAAAGEVSSMPLMGWAGFIDFCNDQVAWYNDHPHRSLPKIVDPQSGRRRHMTPNEAWARAVENGFEAHTVQDDDVRPLFRPQALRTVRRCEIELFGNRYFARALEEFHGDQLRVGYDVHDPSKVWVYEADGRFIGTAELDGNKRDYMPRSVIEQARDKRADARERRLETKLEEVRLERNGMPAIEQQPTVINIPGFMSMPVAQLAERARLAQLVEPLPATPPVQVDLIDPMPEPIGWTVPETPQARYAEWQRLSNVNEEDLESEKQKKWRNTYQASAEFRAFQRKTA